MTTEVRGDVPLDLHPGTEDVSAKVLDVEKTLGPRALAAAREAKAAMYRTYAAINDAETALLAASTRQLARHKPDGRSPHLGELRMTRTGVRRYYGYEQELHAAASEAVERASGVVDRRLEELGRYRDDLEKKVSAALDEPTAHTPEGVALIGKILDHVRALRPSERTLFLGNAVDADDKLTIAAVLGAPGYLSGSDKGALALARDQAVARWAPVESAQAEEIGKVIARVEAAKASLGRRLAKVAELAESAAASPDGKAKKKLEELSNG